MHYLVLKRRIPFLLGILATFLSSCGPVRLISEYDELTYKTVITIQDQVSKFFVELDDQIGSGKADYTNHKQFYLNLKVELNTLKIMTDAIDKNTLVQQQVAALTQMVTDLEAAHKLGFNSRAELIPSRNAFNSALTAIIKLQNGLRRGA